MAEAKKTELAHFPEMAMWSFLRPIDKPAVQTQNTFSRYKAPTDSYDIDVQVPVKHDFSETFQRDRFDGRFVGKGEWHNLVNFL